MLDNPGVRSKDNHGDLAVTHVDWAGVLSADFLADGPIENENPLELACYDPDSPRYMGFQGTLHGLHLGEPVGGLMASYRKSKAVISSWEICLGSGQVYLDITYQDGKVTSISVTDHRLLEADY